MRIDMGRKFRSMYRNLGMNRTEAAKFLQVSERTLHNWESGRHVIPFAAYKLLRLLTWQDLPGRGWEGWSFVCGQLVTPEGRTIGAHESAWWSLLVRLARGFKAQYQENTVYRMRLAQLERKSEPSPGGLTQPESAARPGQAAWARLCQPSPMVITGINYGGCAWRSRV